jgi:hypothetical protein
VGKPLHYLLGFDERLSRIVFKLEARFPRDPCIFAINAVQMKWLQFERSRTANKKARFLRAFYDNLGCESV